MPNGSLGFRHTPPGEGQWNLDLGDIDPDAVDGGGRFRGRGIDLPRFDVGGEGGGEIRRGVPAREVAGHLVTTVFDLLLAQYGVGRPGLPGTWPAGYDDPAPYTPGVAGGDHLGARVHRRAHRPGVRRQRGAVRAAAR